MTEERTNRFNVQLDDEHAAKLHAMADRVQTHSGTIARSVHSTTLDLADSDAATITEILDSIPGALERAQEGLAGARSGRFLPLEEL